METVKDMRGHVCTIRNGAGLRNDESASVEGMPLYMLIMVVVVVISIGILTGIMGGFKGQSIGTVTADPGTIDVEGGRGQVTFAVTVKDTEGRGIGGATVYVQGAGIATAAKTDRSGHASFTVEADLGADAVAEISVRVTHHGTFGEQSRDTAVLLVAQ
jgi:hypothetical protein